MMDAEFPNQSGSVSMADFEIDEIEASTSNSERQNAGTSRLRPRCQYDMDCYRKNPRHLKDYCHPRDSDWNGAGKHRPKPLCPFGEFCTR